MAVKEVVIEVDGVIKSAKFECDRKTVTMLVTMPDGVLRKYTGVDFYLCLGEVRQEFSDVRFLCKGAKINVYPSRMSSQMANGIVAYELRWGEPAVESDMVNIFDYEDQDLVTDIQEQTDYYQGWLQSF
ncbi:MULTISPECIES: hypothetical protein [Pseudomonas]|uniref:hypothetical protein n=1 Tax=Pseudomonas TaxID=286 RepID=UPI001BE6929B|nr:MULTISPECIES: hypothetical protein [Pseudomonas]MBT2341064.1 hypothetical protein [Pseudomonas fluorescens]MCD4529861.1 hypothetical protein [Pseudomonas sp. C3-2018]